MDILVRNCSSSTTDIPFMALNKKYLNFFLCMCYFENYLLVYDKLLQAVPPREHSLVGKGTGPSEHKIVGSNPYNGLSDPGSFKNFNHYYLLLFK